MSIGGSSGGGGGESKEASRLYGVQADISRSLFDEYTSLGSPILSELSADARRADSPAQLNAAADRAAGDVDLSYDRAERDLTRSLGRHGLNPRSGRYAGARRELTLGRAASRAGARTLGRRGARETAYSRRLNALASAQGNVGAAQHGLSSAGAGFSNLAAQRQQAQAQQQAGIGQLIGTGLSLFL